jgi:hypothetical protein
MCVVQQGEMRDTRQTVNLTVDRMQHMALTSNTTMNAEDEDEDKDEDKDGQPYFLQHNNGEVSMSAYKIHCMCDFFLYKMMRWQRQRQRPKEEEKATIQSAE